MDFITNFPILIEWKKVSYDTILIIVNHLTKIIYYKLVKITMNVAGLSKVIINMVVK